MRAYFNQVIQGLDLANTNKRIMTKSEDQKAMRVISFISSASKITTSPAVMVYPKVVNAQEIAALKPRVSSLSLAQNRYPPSAIGRRCEPCGAARLRSILSRASVRG